MTTLRIHESVSLRIHGNQPKIVLGSNDSNALSIDGDKGFNISQGSQKLLQITNEEDSTHES